MQTMHAIAAGLGTPVRLRPVTDPFSGSGTPPLTQEKTAGALQGTTAAIGTQHPDFASLEQSAPALTHRFKAKLLHFAAWLALVFKGVA
jgi:hypothetical protein